MESEIKCRCEDAEIAITLENLIQDVQSLQSNSVKNPATPKDHSTTNSSWREISLVPYEVVSGTDTEDSESDSDSTSSSSDSASSSSSSSDSSSDSESSSGEEDTPLVTAPQQVATEQQNKKKAPTFTKKVSLKTGGEIGLDDLPPIEDLHITIPKGETLEIGTVHAIVDRLVIVQSFANTPALDLDSVLLFDDGTALGQVFDVLGPVICPLYAVRFNSVTDIEAKGIKPGDAVYCAPQHKDLTAFVFVEQLRQIKGSDASWKDNNEPPDECVEYSDDEKEKQAKAKRKSHRTAQLSEGQSEPKPTERVILSPAQPVRKRMCWRGRRGCGNPNYRPQNPQQSEEQRGPRPVVHPPTFLSNGGQQADMAPPMWHPRPENCFNPPRMRPTLMDTQQSRNPFYIREEQFRPRFGETRPQFGHPPFNYAFTNGNGPPPPPPPPPPPTNPFSPHYSQFSMPPPPPFSMPPPPLPSPPPPCHFPPPPRPNCPSPDFPPFRNPFFHHGMFTQPPPPPPPPGTH